MNSTSWYNVIIELVEKSGARQTSTFLFQGKTRFEAKEAATVYVNSKFDLKTTFKGYKILSITESSYVG